MSIEADPLKARGADVAMLSDTLRRGGSALESVPHQIKTLLQSGAWQHFVTRLGVEVHHERFADFVATPPLAGLGASVDLVHRIVASDVESLDLLDQALQRPRGNRGNSDVIRVRQSSVDAGTSRDYALRRLRKDAPELHADVLAGRLSAHRAMVAAGFRPRTFTVRADDTKSTARALRKHMTADQLAELARLLSDGADG